MDLVVFTSKLSTTFDDDVAVSFVSAEIDALIPSKNCFVPFAETEDVNPYCSSKLYDLSLSDFSKDNVVNHHCNFIYLTEVQIINIKIM